MWAETNSEKGKSDWKMTREEALNWLKVINTKKFGWDEYGNRITISNKW